MAYSRSGKPEETQPHPWLLLLLGILIAAAVRWLTPIPPLPLILLALLAASSSVRYPTPRRKTDQPDRRRLAAYRRWHYVKTGLKPSKRWLDPTLPLLAGLALGLLTAAIRPSPLSYALDIPSGIWIAEAWSNRLRHKEDIRNGWTSTAHPRPSISLVKAWRNARTCRILAVSLAALASAAALALYAYAPRLRAYSLALLPLALTAATLPDWKRQRSGWTSTVLWQRRIDAISGDDRLSKSWANTYVAKAKDIGDPSNPLTVLKIKSPQGAQAVWKTGVAVLRETIASQYRLSVCSLLPARCTGQKAEAIDLNWLRLVLAHNADAIPGIADGADEKTASLVANMAYAETALEWGKVPPLVTAHDTAAEDSPSPAWALTFAYPQAGGPDPQRMNLDWLADPNSPQTYLHMPLLEDPGHGFVLAAADTAKLSDKGNKWRAKGALTSEPAFSAYIRAAKRWNRYRESWEALGTKLPMPMPMFDMEKTYEADGIRITRLPVTLDPSVSPYAYARESLDRLDAHASRILLGDTGAGLALLYAYPPTPQRLDMLSDGRSIPRAYAAALAVKAAASTLPSGGTATAESCIQKGKAGTACWRIEIRLHGGATPADLRKKQAGFAAVIGAKTTYWEHQGDDKAILWAMGEPLTAKADAARLRSPRDQKTLIRLALSDAWGVAGANGLGGQAPSTIELAPLPKNPRALLAEFTMPAGLSPARISGASGKFLTAARYQYGRILPQADGMADRFRMILCDGNPMPLTVKADWEYAAGCANPVLPFGCDDMGEPVSWDAKATPHLLVMGATGYGKSSLMRTPVAEAVLRGWQVLIADPSKGGNDFKGWADLKCAGFASQGEYAETAALVSYAEEEMKRRAKTLADHGAASIDDLPMDIRPPRLLLVFDEFNSWLGRYSKTVSNPTRDLRIDMDNAAINRTNAEISRAMASMAAIATQGRSAGVHLLLGAQDISLKNFERFQNGSQFFKQLAKVILGTMGLAGRVSMTNLHDGNILQRSIRNGDAMPKGRGIYEDVQGRLTGVQTWWSGSTADLAALVADAPAEPTADISPWLQGSAGAHPDAASAAAESAAYGGGNAENTQEYPDNDEIAEDIDISIDF